MCWANVAVASWLSWWSLSVTFEACLLGFVTSNFWDREGKKSGQNEAEGVAVKMFIVVWNDRGPVRHLVAVMIISEPLII